MQTNCPSCGAEIEYEFGYQRQQFCPACHHSISPIGDTSRHVVSKSRKKITTFELIVYICLALGVGWGAVYTYLQDAADKRQEAQVTAFSGKYFGELENLDLICLELIARCPRTEQKVLQDIMDGQRELAANGAGTSPERFADLQEIVANLSELGAMLEEHPNASEEEVSELIANFRPSTGSK
jgi:hypothetical protein